MRREISEYIRNRCPEELDIKIVEVESVKLELLTCIERFAEPLCASSSALRFMLAGFSPNGC